MYHLNGNSYHMCGDLGNKQHPDSISMTFPDIFHHQLLLIIVANAMGAKHAKKQMSLIENN